MKTVLRYLIPYRTRMTVGFCIKVVGTLVELFIPYILSHILKDVVDSEDLGNSSCRCGTLGVHDKDARYGHHRHGDVRKVLHKGNDGFGIGLVTV